jgi:hypothetical protein
MVIGNPVIRRTSKLRDRSMRAPKHHFLVAQRPHRLVPLAIAPVMAGDTLKTAALQARVITDPLGSSLAGWHAEYWHFYVRIMDMVDGPAILEKIIDESEGAWTPETPQLALGHGYGINWMQRCLQLILPHYFRSYGEAWDSVMEDSLPVLAIRGRWWFDAYTEDGELPEDDVEAEDYENLWSKWQVLSRNRMTTATYEEWLQTQGVRPPRNLREPDADKKIPELLRYYRDWQYPVSTISPADGTASNAVSWAVNDRLARKRWFGEPGFVVSFAAFRPKAYLPTVQGTGGTASSLWQTGSAAGALNTAKAWIPTPYLNEPGESLRQYPQGTGPLGNTLTDKYWIDHRNLFLDGDQMIHGASQGLALPRRSGDHWRYPTEAGLTALFKNSAATSIRQEGVLSLQIASRVRRTTVPQG